MRYMQILSRMMFLAVFALYFNCGETEHADIPKYHTEDESGIWTVQAENHVPVIKWLNSNTIEVRVGFNPTVNPRHYIETIVLMKGKRTQVDARKFEPSQSIPVAEFSIPNVDDDYWVIVKCNLHDMWKAKVEK